MNILEDNEMMEYALTKGGKTRRASKYSDMYNPNYVKTVEKTMYFIIYREKILELVMSLFKWGNLPNSMNSKNLEKTLHRQGSAVVARHKDSEEICNFRLAANQGELDIYGEPYLFSVHAHEYQDVVHRDEAVIIYNNKLKTSTYRVVNHMAFKLAEADLMISQNLSAQSSTVLITGPESKKKDIMAMYEARANFVPVVVGSKGLAEDVEINVFNTAVPYQVDKIDTHKHVIWNETMTFLGVDNANQEKRERMITGEIEANDTQINLFRESMYMERADAVEKINEMFGTEITVEFNDGIMDELAEIMTVANIKEIQSETELNLADAELKKSQANETEEEEVE